MSDLRTGFARQDRYRSHDTLAAVGFQRDSAESWHSFETTNMAATSGTGSLPGPDAGELERKDDVSLSQRMVSATSGSILTNLLGKG